MTELTKEEREIINNNIKEISIHTGINIYDIMEEAMEKKNKIEILKNKLNKLEGSPKNIKCPGVVRKLRRQLRNLEK